MCYRVPECLRVLPGEHPPTDIREGHRDHDRQLTAQFRKHRLDREDRRFGIQGIEDGLDHDQVDATFNQGFCRLGIVVAQLVEGNAARPGIVHIGRNGCGFRGRPEHAGNVAGLVGGKRCHLIGNFPGDSC